VSCSWAMSIPVCCNSSRLRHPYSVGNVQFFFTFYAFASDCTTVTLEVDLSCLSLSYFVLKILIKFRPPLDYFLGRIEFLH
jgi:hypothetical protein